MEYLPAIIMGLTGSLHCLGMCGPLVLALPQKSQSKSVSMIDSLIYNSGRVIVYGCLGLIIGILGTPQFLTNYQSEISIVIGSVIIAYIFLPAKVKSKVLSVGVSESIGKIYRNTFGFLSKINTRTGLLMLGGLNGLLPCGLVYFALIASATLFDPVKSGLFMIIFGLGTFPAMISVMILKKLITINFRLRIRKLIPIGIALVGLLLIVRGLELGIPYLSPVYGSNEKSENIHCH